MGHFYVYLLVLFVFNEMQMLDKVQTLILETKIFKVPFDLCRFFSSNLKTSRLIFKWIITIEKKTQIQTKQLLKLYYTPNDEYF